MFATGFPWLYVGEKVLQHRSSLGSPTHHIPRPTPSIKLAVRTNATSQGFDVPIYNQLWVLVNLSCCGELSFLRFLWHNNSSVPDMGEYETLTQLAKAIQCRVYLYSTYLLIATTSWGQ
jgi:hypothetical protein